MSVDETLDLDLISIRNIHTCRICLKRENVQLIHNYLSIVNGTQKSEDLTNTLLYCTGIKVCKLDEKPQHICKECFAALKVAYLFKKLCENTEKKLNDAINRENLSNIADFYKAETEIHENGTSKGNGNNESYSNSTNNSTEDPINDTKSPDVFDAVFVKNEITEDSETEDCDTIDAMTSEPSKINTFYCEGCKKAFASADMRLQHERACNTLEDGYKCPHCSLTWNFRVTYDAHLMRHKNNTREQIFIDDNTFLPCPVCKKILKNKYMKKHMQLHTDDKKFVCQICGRTFMRRAYHDIHIQTHSEEKKEACPHCDYRTRQPSSLIVHMRRHTGERPFTCDICGQKSINASNALHHRRRHDLDKYKCNKCRKSFGLRRDLVEHVSIVHEK